MPSEQVKTDAILVTAAQDLNSELTILFSAIQIAASEFIPGTPEAKVLSEALGSIQRCAWLAGSILKYQHRRGLTGIATTTAAATAE